MSTLTLDHERAMNALRELDAAEKHIAPAERARMAKAIIERGDLQAFTLVEYLTAKGYSGPALYHATVAFGKVAADAFRRERGMAPIRVERFIDHLSQTRRVCEYLEADRPLIESAFARWAEGEN